MATGGLYGNASESVGLYGNTTNFGGSYFEWFIFYQSDTQPATPTGGSWSFTTNSGTPPTGWSATPPSAPTLPVWVSIALVNSRSDATLTWSAPGLFSYSSGLPILSGSGAPAPADGINSQLWIQTSTTPQTIWFKQSGTWVRLVGSTLYADLTTNQTIAGIKTFSSPIAGSVTGTAANVTGIVPIINGGTESTTAGGALTNLGAVGTIASADASIVVTRVGSSVDLAVSQTSPASVLLEQVRNITGATLTKGTAVYISGATGQIPTVSKALATSDATSAQTLGLITTDLPNNSNGYVTIIGLISNINTSAYTDGQQLYLSPITAGTLTATKPYAPQHLVYMAVVSYAHPTQGKLLVKVQNGYELDELHNVAAQSPTTGQTIVWNSATSLWEKNTVSLTVGVNGTLPILNGGTGQTTANGAFNALAPSQTGNSGKYLTTDGSNTSWAANPLGTVTSVAASVPSFLSIAGSPITTSGTLAFGLSGTALPTTSGGTGLTSFTSGGVVYASSTSALATGSALTFDGTTLAITGPVSSTRAGTVNYILNDSSSSTSSSLQANSSALYFNANTGAVGAGSFIWRSSSALSELMRLTSTLLYTASTVNIAIGASSGTSGTRLTIQESAANSAALSLLNRNSTQNWKIAVDGVSVDDKLLAFIDNGTSQIRMALTDTGNLGIGTSSPSGKFHVAGTNTGSTFVGGIFSNEGLTAGSTVRLNFLTGEDGTLGRTRAIIEALSPAANDGALVFQTRSAGTVAEKVRIDASGNVGIGTSSPGVKLDVAGAIRLTGNVSTKFGDANEGILNGTQLFPASAGLTSFGAVFGDINASSGITLYGQNHATKPSVVEINTISGNKITYSSSGNLGLGVTPSAWVSTYKAFELFSSGCGVSSDAATKIQLAANFYRVSGADKYGTTGEATLYSQASGVHKWFNAPSGTAGTNITFTQAMTLDTSGRLGIGTTSPNSVVSVAGTAAYVVSNSGRANTAGIDVTSSAGGDGLFGGAISFGTGGSGRSAIAAVQNAVDNDVNGLAFFTHSSGTSSDPAAEKMRITSAGDVGIGTTSPSKLLDVGGVFRVAVSGNAADISGKSDNTGGLNLYGGGSFNTGAGLLLTGTSAGNANTIIFTRGAFVESMRLDSAGNLGIGTSSPTQKLEVNGAAQFGSGNTTSSGGLSLRVGVYTTVPSNATDAFVGVHNTGGAGITAGDLILMPRSSTGVNNNIVFLTGQTTPTARATIDSAGNLGLGVTPSAWGASKFAMQLGARASLYGANNLTVLGNNYYDNGTNNIYIATAAATDYYQSAGTHVWRTAPSGTAGTNISFTQAMTLDASGNLGLGVTPSAWESSSALQMGSTAATNYGYSKRGVLQNAYFDGSVFKYFGTGGATYYQPYNGSHVWATAASGTAGNTATFSTTMTLNASGGLQTLNTIGVGNATPSTSGAGITFPATQSASSDANTLDDYEEGTWTPNQGSGLILVGTFSSTGNYTKIGRMVYVSFKVAGSTSVGFNSGTAICTNLPFAAITNPQQTGTAINDATSAGVVALAFNNTVYSASSMAATTAAYFNISYQV